MGLFFIYRPLNMKNLMRVTKKRVLSEDDLERIWVKAVTESLSGMGIITE